MMMSANGSLASIGLIALLVACGSVDRAERALPREEESGSGSSTLQFDETATIEAAMAYEERLALFTPTIEGAETHSDATSVAVWGSPDAMDAFWSIDPSDPAGVVSFPEGTTFVKEHFDPMGAVVGLTVMHKAPAGYAPATGDWFWARIRGGEVTQSGQLNVCIQCHETAHNTDYVVGFRKSD